jgi:hypothetical protein
MNALPSSCKADNFTNAVPRLPEASSAWKLDIEGSSATGETQTVLAGAIVEIMADSSRHRCLPSATVNSPSCDYPKTCTAALHRRQTADHCQPAVQGVHSLQRTSTVRPHMFVNAARICAPLIWSPTRCVHWRSACQRPAALPFGTIEQTAIPRLNEARASPAPKHCAHGLDSCGSRSLLLHECEPATLGGA